MHIDEILTGVSQAHICYFMRQSLHNFIRWKISSLASRQWHNTWYMLRDDFRISRHTCHHTSQVVSPLSNDNIKASGPMQRRPAAIWCLMPLDIFDYLLIFLDIIFILSLLHTYFHWHYTIIILPLMLLICLDIGYAIFLELFSGQPSAYMPAQASASSGLHALALPYIHAAFIS